MPDIISFSLVLIILTLLLSFVKRMAKDACLKEFEGDPVTVIFQDGNTISGKLRVEQSGVEFLQLKEAKGGSLSDSADGDLANVPASYILYSQEYTGVLAFVRYRESLSPGLLKKRKASLKAIYSPTVSMKIKKGILNMFKLARDGFVDILDLIIGAAKVASPVGRYIPKGEKKSGQISQEIGAVLRSAYEPLIEVHIGRTVILETLQGAAQLGQVKGILKGYTASFIHLMDVSFQGPHVDKPSVADLILRREECRIRHLAKGKQAATLG